MPQPIADIKHICDVLSAAWPVCALYKKGICKTGQKCFIVDFFFLTHYFCLRLLACFLVLVSSEGFMLSLMLTRFFFFVTSSACVLRLGSDFLHGVDLASTVSRESFAVE